MQNPSLFKRIVALYLALLHALPVAHGQAGAPPVAASSEYMVKPRLNNLIRADEFYAEAAPGEILITVHVLGAVRKPGIYHVPKQTDMIYMVSLAGGTDLAADLTRVTIKRRNREHERVLLMNLEDTFQRPGVQAAVLETGDVVMIPEKEPAVSTNTITLVGLISSIISIIVSGLLLSKSLGKS